MSPHAVPMPEGLAEAAKFGCGTHLHCGHVIMSSSFFVSQRGAWFFSPSDLVKAIDLDKGSHVSCEDHSRGFTDTLDSSMHVQPGQSPFCLGLW